MKFHIAGSKAVIVVYCAADHLHAMVVCQKSSTFLERVLRRNDKPHLIEIAIMQHRIGNNEMADMNGIKRAEKEANFLVLW